MRSEKEKMLAGDLYDPLDPVLSTERRRARLLLKALNDTTDDQMEERARLVRELIPTAGSEVWIEPPFYCDYGTNLTLGDKVFFNFNCIVLDVAPVVIGSRVLIGPAVQLHAATHPLSAVQRRTGLELGKPIHIGDDVTTSSRHRVFRSWARGSERADLRSCRRQDAHVPRERPTGRHSRGPCACW